MQKTVTSPSPKVTVPRLFVLELNAGCIHLMNTDGSDHTTIVTGCHLPDGIVVDVEAGHIYWTNMGIPNLNDGSVERADIDGKNRKTVIAKGDTHTPKQIVLDKKGGKLYWCDREGMRVMRCNLDGSQLETLIEAGRGEADEPRAPLQAGATIGSVALRESLNVIMAGRQASVDPGRLILTTGAQQALDLLSRVTLDPGDIVFVERPTYAMAPQTFDLSQADVRGLTSDDGGIDVEHLDRDIVAARRSSRTPMLI